MKEEKTIIDYYCDALMYFNPELLSDPEVQESAIKMAVKMCGDDLREYLYSKKNDSLAEKDHEKRGFFDLPAINQRLKPDQQLLKRVKYPQGYKNRKEDDKNE